MQGRNFFPPRIYRGNIEIIQAQVQRNRLWKCRFRSPRTSRLTQHHQLSDKLLKSNDDSTITGRKRLLVFQLRQLGDAANSVPFIRGAMEVFDVFICCQPSVAVLYEMVVEPGRIIRWSAPWGRQSGKYNVFQWDWSASFGCWQRFVD